MTRDIQENYYKNELGKFYYRVAGPEDAPVVVFSHGVAMDHQTFDAQVAALADEYRVITWDMPFHGRSDAIDRNLRFSKVSADLVVGILDELGIQQAVMAGLSLGSFVVQRLSAHHPERVLAEIHISGGPLYPKFPGILRTAIPLVIVFMELYPEKALGSAFAKHKALTEDTIAYLKESIKATGKDSVIHLTNEMIRDMAEGLPAPPDKPTLIVIGDHEIPAIIQMNQRWHERLHGSELVMVENAHHILNQDNPDGFNQVLIDYLERVVKNR